ncbi:hypothetical protein [Sphingomonas sp. NIBR02145]|uniref:hypothetical protein n=1 Tax=Sphingomonas sp. NIBR02145 TaxID=3014784 RepID=UPI0022B58690|nr:hypothetical protein [Sphingomonas sp. NIBR02145]WHU02296.1 hypothetical protein O3305_19255 [Sphingomonas sp. NIBR02145]
MRAPDLDEDGWCLASAVDYHALDAEVFDLPDEATRTGLKPGDFAKLIFLIAVEEDEEPITDRMWVVVRETADGGYFGLLDNEPDIDENDEFWLGTEVPFGPEHVIEVQAGNDESIAYAARTPLKVWPRG